uniref:Argonaute family member n=1 Tax=Physcomitrium patens TaxID=3218 RepID=A0A7I4DTR0_PHYPA
MAQGKGNSVQRRRQKAEGAVPISAAGEGGGEGPRAGPSLSGPVGRCEVSIEPETVSKRMCREIMKKLRETYGNEYFDGKHGAYDGEKSLFTSGCLPFKSMKFSVLLDNFEGSSCRPGDSGRPSSASRRAEPLSQRRAPSKVRKFDVSIELAAKIRMDAIEEMMKRALGRCDQELQDRALDALRVLDVILREIASRRGYLLVRDNFFHPSLGQVCDLGDGVEGWRGYHSSVRPTLMGLMLNLDTTMTVVLKPTLVDEFLKERFNVRDLSGLQKRDWAKAKDMLKNVRIETTHTGVSRKYRISGFSDRSIRELKFMKGTKDGNGEEEISVYNYFFDTYSRKLKNLNFPALDLGNSRKPIYMPIELCKIVSGQRYTKPLSSKQRMAQIGASKQAPQERQKICENALKVCNYSSDKLIAEFGLQFDNKLASVSGRVLPAPQLDFGNGKTEEPKEGRWNFNHKTLKKGVTIAAWAVAVFDPCCNDGDRIAFQLIESCSRRGMVMKSPAVVQKQPRNSFGSSPEERVETMFNALRPYAPVFILAILAEKDSPIYVPFKRLCEIRLGIISQCMVKPRTLNDQFLGNLALKINLKMGGLNSPLSQRMLHCLGQSTIIFGMDVTHGSPGDVEIPSIAAVVATKNWPEVFHYSTQVKVQPARMEMIQGLYEPEGGMVRELLMSFYSTCAKGVNPKPSQIIIYRDGVSDSMFAKCLEVEFVAFKRACAELEAGYNPGITFIVAKKRHGTRFFPQSRDALRNGNVLPGTVVDKDACHPRNFDFFLISQAGLIGTARPTHYTILVNENQLGPDDIQTLTNKLCYTFGRCTSSISMAAPAAYAHILASRYRKLMSPLEGGSTTSSSSSRGIGVSRPLPPVPILRMKADHSMFFC